MSTHLFEITKMEEIDLPNTTTVSGLVKHMRLIDPNATETILRILRERYVDNVVRVIEWQTRGHLTAGRVEVCVRGIARKVRCEKEPEILVDWLNGKQTWCAVDDVTLDPKKSIVDLLARLSHSDLADEAGLGK
jgi:hypothetical protein